MILSSCSTTNTSKFPEPLKKTAEQRIAYCISENINEYIGNCVIDQLKIEPVYPWLTVLEMWDDWNTLTNGNNNIYSKYQNKEIDVSDANQLFVTLYKTLDDVALQKQYDMYLVNEAQRMKQAQMWIAIGQALKTPQSSPTFQTPMMTKYLTSQIPLQNGRVQCTYGVGITSTVIVNYGSSCSPSIVE